jgi:predicted nucleotidyltransferase
MRAVPKITTDQPEKNERFNRTLADTVTALEEARIQYCFIGGIASHGLGRPRATHDIDVFVRPEDTEIALRALSKHGFRTERTDPSWLYKGWKENVLVDVIFKSKGEIYLDAEMYQRSIHAEFHGKSLRLVAPEDLLIIKASAHSELCPGHWHDALALIAHANLDWSYLIHRAKRAPRRVLSLLIYATSNDIQVPKHVTDEIFRMVFGDALFSRSPAPGQSQFTSQPPTQVATHQNQPRVHLARPRPDQGAVARLREAVARDSRTNELDIEIECEGERILLRGEVMSRERRDAAECIARELFPEFAIENQLRVTQYSEPPEIEDVR